MALSLFGCQMLIVWDVNFKNLKRKENGKLNDVGVGWIWPTKGKRENDEMHVQRVCAQNCQLLRKWICNCSLSTKKPNTILGSRSQKKGSSVSWPFKEHISLRSFAQQHFFLLIFFPFRVGYIYHSKKKTKKKTKQNKINKQKQNKPKRQVK